MSAQGLALEGGFRVFGTRKSNKPLRADGKAAATDAPSMLVVQVEGALNALWSVSDSTGDTEDMVRLSVKLQRVRLGPHC